MEQKPSKRYEITEVNKYYADRWVLLKQGSRFDLSQDDTCENASKKHGLRFLLEITVDEPYVYCIFSFPALPGQLSVNPNLLSPDFPVEPTRKNSFKVLIKSSINRHSQLLLWAALQLSRGGNHDIKLSSLNQKSKEVHNYIKFLSRGARYLDQGNHHLVRDK